MGNFQKSMMAVRHHIELGIYSIQPKLLEIKFRRKHDKVGNSSFSKMKVIGILKIQDGGRCLCWIFMCNI